MCMRMVLKNHVQFDALCDGMVARGGIECLLDYTEGRLDAVAKHLQG
jgi:hypothetical protein